jgi:two-component system cell cycle sensor histidine kinase PleC
LSCDIDPAVTVVRGDAAKLHQAISNLLSNSIKFTLPGGKVALSARPNPDGDVAITISDTGVGMSEEELAQAMQPFGQVDATRSRWREGAGLGLPIARALATLHGGTLTMQSIKGVGTEATLTLPNPDLIGAAAGDEAGNQAAPPTSNDKQQLR